MEWVVLIHVLAGAVLFGGQFYVESLMATAGRTKDPETIMTVGTKVGATNSRIFFPAGLVVLITGIWIVLGRSFTFEMLFVTIGFALTILALANGLFLIKPRFLEVGEFIEEKGLTDPETMAKAKALGNLGHVQTLFVTIIIIVMVLKPGM
ncbi:MAG: DUF2269 family protein [Actinomycetota bacterium]